MTRRPPRPVNAHRAAPPLPQGKVRDTYDIGDKLVIVTTDRQSAFDRILAAIPFKGQVLNQTSAWWLEHTTHIVRNALVSTPDPNITVMDKCTVLPVEIVVRGYMTGSTSTSLWTHYKDGVRTYCGNDFPDGLAKNDKLPANVVTPTTKAEDHDEPISPAVRRDLGVPPPPRRPPQEGARPGHPGPHQPSISLPARRRSLSEAY